MRVAIAGIAGRMGRQLAKAVIEGGHGLAGGTEQPGHDLMDTDLASLAGAAAPLGRTPCSNPSQAAMDADVWIDFTAPVATLAALDALASTPVRVAIIGTTGFTAEQDRALATHANRLAIVKAGNFSLGVNLLSALSRIAAARLGADWDAEILETHHRHKVDAPSGTALMLGEAVATGRGVRLEDVQAAPYLGPDARREPGTVGFAVRRSGGVVGAHELTFSSPTETLALSHTALDRSVFADGAIAAAVWAVNQSPGLYDMEDVLGLKGLAG